MLHEIYYRYPKNFPLPMVLDGSTGTSLMREGMPSGACTEDWVLEHPEVIEKIQREYLEAGANAVYSPTFGANRPTLERNGLSDVERINKKLVSLSIGKGGLVGGDMSPSGLFIEPFGDATFDEVVEVYREQAEILDKGGVDFFICETNISLQEVRAEVIGIREVSDKPIFVTMTVDENGRTLSGDDLTCCLLTLAELGISAFGTNCSQGPDSMIPLLKKLAPYSISLGIPLIAKPNAGMPHEDECGCRHFDLDADSFAKFIPELMNSGVTILGGCCGTDSGFIKKLREIVDEISPKLDLSGIQPIDTGKLVCTNRELVDIDELLKTDAFAAPIEVEEDFTDEVDDDSVPYFRIADSDASDIFVEDSYLLTTPCVLTGDKDAIEKAKRYYNGKFIVKLQ